MPTVQGTDDFNHAIDAGYYTDGFFTPGAGNPEAVAAPLYRSQQKSLHIITGAGNSGARHNLTGTPTRGWAAFPWQTPDTLADCTICGFQSLGTDVGRLAMGTTGLYLYTSTAPPAASFAVDTNTWYWIEMIFDVSTGTHQVYGRIAGEDMPAPTGHVAAASTVDFHQLIGLAGDTATIDNYYGYWEWGSAASNSDWAGEPGAAQPSDDPPIGFLGRGAGW